MKSLYHALLVPLSFFLVSTPAHAKPDGEIEIVAIEGTHVNKGVIHQVLHGSFEEIWAILIDAERFPRTMPRNEETMVLEQNQNFIRYHARMNMPWPISDIQYDCDMHLDKAHQRINFEMVPGSGKGVKNFKGHWQLESKSANETLATHELLFEPEVLYPQWAFNLGLKSTLGQVMKKIQTEIDLQHSK